MNRLGEIAERDPVEFLIKEVRPHRGLNLGFQLAERGRIEGAIVAFRDALGATLASNCPDDLRMRRTAADQLVRLMRESAEQNRGLGK